MYKITSQRQIRTAFWNFLQFEEKPKRLRGKSQNDMPAEIRCAFVDYVDMLARDGVISERLAERVTL